MTLKTIQLTGSFFLVLLALLLAGCETASQPGQPIPDKTPYFRPPTPVGVSPSPASPSSQSSSVENLPAEAASGPTATVQCKDSLTFLADLTIPDGTIVSPESTMDKRWEVENSGNCNWGETYRVRLIAGNNLGAQQEQALYPARSGSRAVIRMVFKAPVEPGTYRSAWQAYDPQGEPFGDPFFIDIVVQ